MSGGRLYSNSEVISPPSIPCFCFMVKLVYLCAQSNQRARCPTSFTVIGWLYKTPVSNSLDNSPPSLLAGRRTEPLSDSMQMTTIDNQIFFSHALTSYGFKRPIVLKLFQLVIINYLFIFHTKVLSEFHRSVGLLTVCNVSLSSIRKLWDARALHKPWSCNTYRVLLVTYAVPSYNCNIWGPWSLLVIFWSLSPSHFLCIDSSHSGSGHFRCVVFSRRT